MTDIPLEEPAPTPARNWFAVQIALALALTALADWLFLDHYPGINVTLFALGLCIATVLGIGVQQRGMFLPATAVLFLGIAPAVESLGFLSFLFAAAGVVFFVLTVTLEHTRQPREWLRRTRRLIFGGPIHLCGDLRRFCIVLVSNGSIGAFTARFSIWIIPILLGFLFIWIFAAANPVIDDVLQSLEFKPSAVSIDVQRTILWILIFSFIWPFVRLRNRNLQIGASAGASSARKASGNRVSGLIKTESILVSLVIFNLIFAAQNVLDFAYLWGSAKLPDGMTYAEYAHRGAYPLMWATLLSAAFVLIALRPGTSAERIPTVRVLVFLWLGQNVLLVFSAATRLNLYIEAYALTWPRVTAFVCMWLIAIGLILIVIRIAHQRTNRWLVASNAIAVILTFYVYSFINFDGIIASYNIINSREVSGAGSNLDRHYLRKLGPNVIPALDSIIKLPEMQAGKPENSGINPDWTWAGKIHVYEEPFGDYLTRLRSQLARKHTKPNKNWRAWSFRGPSPRPLSGDI